MGRNYQSGAAHSKDTCNANKPEEASCQLVDAKKDSEIKVFFTTTMGPTVFTVTEPALDGSVSIVPAGDHSSALTFEKKSVMSMMSSAGITVKETGVPHPKGATCEFKTAGPIEGEPECKVFFSLVTIHCECLNFPRSQVLV